mgnify:CR=1 FL=1
MHVATPSVENIRTLALVAALAGGGWLSGQGSAPIVGEVLYGAKMVGNLFLDLLRIDHMEDGEACESPTPCGRQDVQCMRLGRRGLCVCADGRPRGGLSGGQSQTIWPRVSLSSDAMR